MAEKTQDMHLPSLKVHGEVFEDYRNEAIEFNYICVSLLSAKRQRKDNGIYFPIMLGGQLSTSGALATSHNACSPNSTRVRIPAAASEPCKAIAAACSGTTA